MNKYKLLIIDDEPSNLKFLTFILDGDYTIYAAKNGLTGIEFAKKHRPDLILLDIVMPVMDGYEVLSVLGSLEETKNIPVIITTGLEPGDEKAKDKDFQSKISGWITKPFNSETVKSTVRNQLTKKIV